MWAILPACDRWRRSRGIVEGGKVQGNFYIKPGTAIATFGSNGNYFGHTAIFLGQDYNGIQVLDQWNIRENGLPGGKIIRSRPPSVRTLYFRTPQKIFVDRGEVYHVVE